MNLTDFIDGRRDQHLAELFEFLRIPSVSAKSEHKSDIERGASWVAGNLRAAGFKKIEIVPTALHPLVYAESLEALGKPTILFYGHYDVQPPEPLDLWTSPAFEPTVRNGNLFGRGTADDKGQVHIHLKALASLQQVNGKFPINIKVLIEGEEEVGSVSLWDFVQKNKEKLKADALVVSDTSMLGKGVPSITYGLRGLSFTTRIFVSLSQASMIPSRRCRMPNEKRSTLCPGRKKILRKPSERPAMSAKPASPQSSGFGRARPSN